MSNVSESTWEEVKLGDVLQLRHERARGSEQLLSVTQDRGVVRQVDAGRRDISSHDKSAYWRVYPGDIVYNTMRMWQGVVGRSEFDGIVSPAYTVCRSVSLVDTRFLAYKLRHSAMIARFYRLSQGLVSDTWNLKYSSFSTIRMNLPSRREQQQIVEILNAIDNEILVSEQCAAKLARIEWGLLSTLITRVLDEASSGSRGWKWSTVRESGEVQLGRQRSPEHESGRFMAPYLRVANVFDGYISYSDVLQMNFTPTERRVYDLRKGDILLNEGQSLELVGRCAIYDGPDGIFFQNTLVRYRCGQLLPEFARAIFKYWLEVGEFMKIAKQTTNVAHLGADRFAGMPIPVGPKSEQRRVINVLSQASQQLTSIVQAP